MKDHYKYYAELINQQFSGIFDARYKSGDKYQQAKLLPCLANIYRRWYYSSLVENTYLTPANLFESLNRQAGCAPDISPNVHMNSTTNYTGLTYSYQNYNRSGHPVVKDFRTIIDFCRPDIDLTPEDQMPEELAVKAAKDLHMNDPSYAMYLLSLALEMGLLVKIPSIYVNHAQLVKDIEERMTFSDEEMFDKIVQYTLKFASKSLSEIVPVPVPLFDEEYLVSILKEPVETDAIFQRLYDTMGVDIEDLMGLEMFEEIEMLDMAVISGTYLLGIVLDKFFLTPFGHYLKLIRPIYMLPFDFENEITIFLDSYIDEDELGIAFYAPCSHYYLTDLGLNYFKINPNLTNYLDIENKLKFSQVATLFENNKIKDIRQVQALSAVFERESCIYSLKVKYLSEPKLWLNIDVSDITNLHRLYLELAYYFDLDKNGEYTFFPDTTENPFLAYASPNQARRAKKSSDTTLGSLKLEEKQQMILAVSYPRVGGSKHKEKWTLEVIKIHEGKAGQTYPAVTRLGKALKGYFEWQ